VAARQRDDLASSHERRLGAGRLDRQAAATWISRYEAMMVQEVAGRSAQLDIVADAAHKQLASESAPLAVELGCGPGTLARRLAAALPRLEVVAVDADPVLLALAGAMDHPQVRIVEATVGIPGWTARLKLARDVDLVIAVAVIHYLDRTATYRLYRDAAELLGPGGALLLADDFHFAETPMPTHPHQSGGALDDLPPACPAAQSWTGWWDAVDAEPQLAEIRRRPVVSACARDSLLLAAEHVEWLRAAGFDSVATIWRHEESAVLLADRR
jgi:SAM-dependent methyltransferase